MKGIEMMKQSKKVFVVFAMACLLLGLCACGNTQSGDSEKKSENHSSETEQVKESEKDSQVEENKYIIKVVDEDGNPMANVMVQLCDDANCMPNMTDANGVAKFNYKEGVVYTGKIATMPEGYDYATDEHEFVFDGVTEVTIVLKKTV